MSVEGQKTMPIGVCGPNIEALDEVIAEQKIPIPLISDAIDWRRHFTAGRPYSQQSTA